MEVWHPWRFLATHLPHITVSCQHRLPRGVRGLWRGTSVWLCSTLTQAERRSTLTHELLHVERGLVPNHLRDSEERVVDELAARRLITLPALTEALRYSQEPRDLAEHLWVDIPTVRARMATLDPIEVAELEHALDGNWMPVP